MDYDYGNPKFKWPKAIGCPEATLLPFSLLQRLVMKIKWVAERPCKPPPAPRRMGRLKITNQQIGSGCSPTCTYLEINSIVLNF